MQFFSFHCAHKSFFRKTKSEHRRVKSNTGVEDSTVIRSKKFSFIRRRNTVHLFTFEGRINGRKEESTRNRLMEEMIMGTVMTDTKRLSYGIETRHGS